MTIFINCPICGKRLLEGETGSKVTVKCSVCGHISAVDIKDDAVVLHIGACSDKRSRNDVACGGARSCM